jgi:hypothetical protein
MIKQMASEFFIVLIKIFLREFGKMMLLGE